MEGELSRADRCLIKVWFLHGVELSGHTGGVVSTRSDGQLTRSDGQLTRSDGQLTRSDGQLTRSDGPQCTVEDVQVE